VAAALLGGAMLLAVPPPASAAPVPEESYRGELAAAIEATGAFTTGSTVLLEVRDGRSGDRI
jgi:hypothetical protein